MLSSFISFPSSQTIVCVTQMSGTDDTVAVSGGGGGDMINISNDQTCKYVVYFYVVYFYDQITIENARDQFCSTKHKGSICLIYK